MNDQSGHSSSLPPNTGALPRHLNSAGGSTPLSVRAPTLGVPVASCGQRSKCASVTSTGSATMRRLVLARGEHFMSRNSRL